MPRHLVTAGITALLLALYVWGSPVLKSVFLHGNWLPSGDVFDGKLWLASPDYSSFFTQCWVVVTSAGNVTETCFYNMVIEDIRADGDRKRLWGAARDETNAYVVKWSGDKWEVAYTFEWSQWDAYKVDVYTIDILPDGRIATLLYIYRKNETLKDVRLVIIDAEEGAISLDKSIAEYGFDTRQEAALAVHDNTILIAQAKKLEGDRYEIRVVAVDANTLRHKVIFQEEVDADRAWSLTVRKAATPKSYVAIALVRGSNYTIIVYGPSGRTAYTSVKIREKWEEVDSARRVLLTTSDSFYSAIIIKSRDWTTLYLVGDRTLIRVWKVPSWGGAVAYIKEWGTIVLGPGLRPWKWGINAVLITRDMLVGIRLAEHPEPPSNFVLTPTPVIENDVACIEFNNPPLLTGYEYVIHWTVFKVRQDGGDPCDGPNLFLGDLRADELVHLYYYNGFTDYGDGDSSLGKYGKLYIIGDKTIMGVFNVSNGLFETTYYQLVGDLPVVYINFTVKNAPRRTVFWYGIYFINDIIANPDPGETRWVEALGVGDYSFPAQDPQGMYNLALQWGFEAKLKPILTPTKYIEGYWTDVYIPPSAGNFVWMRINRPGVGKYYLALYPLTNIKAYYISSESGFTFNKIIGLVFANGTTTAEGALLLIYGKSLEEVRQNLYKALERVASKSTDFLFVTTGSIVVNVYNVNGKPASTVPGVVYGLLVNTTNMNVVARAYLNTNSQLVFDHVNPGTYMLYVYHYPNLGLNYTEYWGNLTVTVAAGQTSTYNFTRDMPWIKSVQATYLGNNKYVITVTVINPQKTLIAGRVFLYISPNKDITNAAEFVNNIIYKPGTNEFTFTYTPPTSNTYYAYVMIDAYVSQYWGKPIPTDQYSWTEIIQAPPPKAPQIILVGDAVVDVDHDKIYLTSEKQYTNGAVFWQSYFNDTQVVTIEISGGVNVSSVSTPGDGFVFYLFLNPSNWGIEPQYNHTMIPHYPTNLDISPVMGKVLFPQSKTPYIVVQWDPVWQNTHREVGKVGQWNVWIVGPDGRIIKAWNGIGVGSLNSTIILSYRSPLYITVSYDPRSNTLFGLTWTLSELTWSIHISFFALKLDGNFKPPSSGNYIFGVGAATGLHRGKWYLNTWGFGQSDADTYDSIPLVSFLKSLINSSIHVIGLPGGDKLPSNLVSIDFSRIIDYEVIVNFKDYTKNGVTYVPIPRQLTINLRDLLWPQAAYTGGAGFMFSRIYIVYIPKNNLGDSAIVENWNPFRDMYSYANYGTSYSPGGNCYGFSSTAILYFRKELSYPLQDYGPTSNPTATAQLYLGQVYIYEPIDVRLKVSPPQYPLTPAALVIAIHQIFDTDSLVLWAKIKQITFQANDFDNLKMYINSGSPVLLGLWQTIGGAAHAVVAWGYAKLANGSYAILISDPNYPGSIRVAIYTPTAILGFLSSFKYVWDGGTTFNYFLVREPTPAKWDWFIKWLGVIWFTTLSEFPNNIWKMLLNLVRNELSTYTLVVVRANSQSKIPKVYLKSNPTVYATFTRWGDSQSFVGNIPGSAGVFDGEVVVFAIPNQYAGDLVIDPVGTSVGVFVMQVTDSAFKGFLVNATSANPINVTISLTPAGLVAVSNSSAVLNVTGFYVNKSKVVANAKVVTLEPNKPVAVNSSELTGVPWVESPCFDLGGSTICPRDVNGDGLFEDINGNGRLDFNDVVLFFRHFNVFREYPQYFDFNRNRRVDFDDVVTLYKLVLGSGT